MKRPTSQSFGNQQIGLLISREDLQLDYFAKNYCIFTHTCHLDNLNSFKHIVSRKQLLTQSAKKNQSKPLSCKRNKPPQGLKEKYLTEE